MLLVYMSPLYLSPVDKVLVNQRFTLQQFTRSHIELCKVSEMIGQQNLDFCKSLSVMCGYIQCILSLHNLGTWTYVLIFLLIHLTHMFWWYTAIPCRCVLIYLVDMFWWYILWYPVDIMCWSVLIYLVDMVWWWYIFLIFSLYILLINFNLTGQSILVCEISVFK